MQTFFDTAANKHLELGGILSRYTQSDLVHQPHFDDLLRTIVLAIPAHNTRADICYGRLHGIIIQPEAIGGANECTKGTTCTRVFINNYLQHCFLPLRFRWLTSGDLNGCCLKFYLSFHTLHNNVLQPIPVVLLFVIHPIVAASSTFFSQEGRT